MPGQEDRPVAVHSFRNWVVEGRLSSWPSKLSDGLAWSPSPQSRIQKSHRQIVPFKGARAFQTSVEHVL